MQLQAGVARASLTPFWGVELAGWGYYLSRSWTRVRDPLAATALVLDNGHCPLGLVAVDLMYADADFVSEVRRRVAEECELPTSSILVGCSHSHNTPTVALIRGAGEQHQEYKQWAARQAATALIEAWHQRKAATFSVARTQIEGWVCNRTRDNGPIDTQLSLWRIDTLHGHPLAAVVNYQSHPTVMMSLGPRDVSRDFPGMITDQLEEQYPGLKALYFQGSGGDLNFLPEYNSPERCHLPGEHLAERAIQCYQQAERIEQPHLGVSTQSVTLPTRRWTHEEIQQDREEGQHRLTTGDTEGWRDNIGRVMVNQPEKFVQRYGGDLSKAVKAISRFAVEWTEEMLRDVDSRPETLITEVQAMRVGNAWLVANPSELFSSLALDLRSRWAEEHLMIVGYANDSIGYVPDAYDVERQSYAANQSPKFKNQFPFVKESGGVMVQGMLNALSNVG